MKHTRRYESAMIDRHNAANMAKRQAEAKANAAPKLFKVGMLVRRSDHQIKELGFQRGTIKLGIVTDLSHYDEHGDLQGKLMDWPHVHWQDAPVSSLCNPINVTIMDKR